jgi:glycosyl transferase family 25
MEIVCINLKTRKDKYKVSKQLFDQYDIPATFFFAEKKENGRIGCFESHIEVIRSCYEKGGERIWILEDDFYPTSSFSKEALHDVFNNIDDSVEYCQLGYSLLPHELVSYFTAKRKGCLLQYNGNCTHSYVLTRKGMKRILDHYEDFIETTHLDYFYRDLFKEYGWCSCPMLFDQNFCLGTDNAVEEEGAYFQWLRWFSCIAHRFSIMYLCTLLRAFIVEICLFFIYIFSINNLKKI